MHQIPSSLPSCMPWGQLTQACCRDFPAIRRQTNLFSLKWPWYFIIATERDYDTVPVKLFFKIFQSLSITGNLHYPRCGPGLRSIRRVTTEAVSPLPSSAHRGQERLLQDVSFGHLCPPSSCLTQNQQEERAGSRRHGCLSCPLFQGLVCSKYKVKHDGQQADSAIEAKTQEVGNIFPKNAKVGEGRRDYRSTARLSVSREMSKMEPGKKEPHSSTVSFQAYC